MERFLNFPFVFLFRHNATGSNCFLPKERLFLLFYLVNVVRCSALLSNAVQKGIRYSDYCPKMEHCMAGAHVMCMYYNPSVIMGPKCGEGQNITFTPELVELMLGIVNQIRATVARGEETGKDGVALPKAHGMIRLRWDQELATFAQIWANQCTIQHDLCRATKRFPNPAQLVSLVRFTYPDWRLINDNSSEPNKNDGLTMSKLKHTITTTMKISYAQKDRVTREMIEQFPDLTMFPQLASIRVFMTMIHAGSTHMGCGISAYADYYGKDTHSIIVNNVQVVCNFSAQPRPGSSVFDTRRAPGTSPRCGCPADTLEDGDCLCVPRRYRDPTGEIRTCSKYDPECSSPEDLPIISGDAPPITLYHTLLSNGSFSRRSPIQSNYQSYGNNIFVSQRQAQLSKAKLPKSNEKSDNLIGYKTRVNDVRNRYFDKQHPAPRYRIGSPIREGEHVPRNRKFIPSRRNSIFTRASNFKLPLQSKQVDHGIFQTNFITKERTTIKKDVKPRKDFSNVQNIATAYLNKIHSNHTVSQPVNHLISVIDTNTPKFGIAGFNTKISTKHLEIKNPYEETDNKLLTLLDNLEEEVKHIQLNGDIKDMFDARIRKIYGNVVGDHKLLSADTRIVDDLIKNVQKKTENKESPVQAHVDMPEVEFAMPQRRRQNSISPYENTIPDTKIRQYMNKQGTFDRTYRQSYNNLHKTNNKRRGYKQDNKNDDFFSDDEDLLGPERRRFYQKKLENIERKLKSIRGYKRGDLKQDKDHFFRPVIRSRQAGVHQDTYKVDNHLKTFYVPDRAKFLHGF